MRIASSCLGLALVLVLALPAGAQEHEGMDHDMHHDMTMPESGVRAEVIADLEMTGERITGLASALEGSWEWRPAEGVRSVREVLGHVAAANFLFPSMAGVAPPEEFQGADQQETMGNLMALEQVADPAEMMRHVGHSFMHARHAVARIPDERLDEMIQYLGREGTVRSLLVALAGHNHEHLGQLIAYARMNGVVPPWSAGGQ